MPDHAADAASADAAMSSSDASVSYPNAAVPYSDSPYFGQVPIDGPWMMGAFRGLYYPGTENESFRPCGILEVWETGVIDISPVSSPAECTNTMTPSYERCSIFLEVVGELSSYGRYQHQTGPTFDRQLRVEHIDMIRLAVSGDCTDSTDAGANDGD